jgi:alkylated DNA repair dioxygenase AlkB
MNASLFEMESPKILPKDTLGPGTAFLCGFALDAENELLSSLKHIVERSPSRNMVTPGGFRMSVALTNCGAFGWVTDRTGYRYDRIDPETCHSWPEMPALRWQLKQKFAIVYGKTKAVDVNPSLSARIPVYSSDTETSCSQFIAVWPPSAAPTSLFCCTVSFEPFPLPP